MRTIPYLVPAAESREIRTHLLTDASDRYTLDQILSGEMTEIVVEHIHEYLRSVGENIRAGRMKLEDFIIFKVCTCSRGSDGNTRQTLLLTSELLDSAWERIRRITRTRKVSHTCKSR